MLVNIFLKYIILQTGNISCINDEDIIMVNHTVSTPTPTSRKNSAVSSKPLAEVKDDGNSSTPVICVKAKELGSLG